MAEQTPRRALAPTASAPAAPGNGAPPSAPRPARAAGHRVARRGRFLTAPRAALTLIALAVALTIALGGLNPVDADDTPQIPTGQVNQPLSIGPATVSLARVRHADALPPIAPATADTTYFFAVVTVSNTSAKPLVVTPVASALALDVAGPAAARPSLYRLDDSLAVRAFPPGVPLTVVAVWSAPRASLPQEARLTLSTLTWYEYFSSDDAEWQVSTPAYAITAPIEEVPPR